MASNAMPDSPLYPVKLATEQVQIQLTPSNVGKAELYAKAADRRVAEISYMAEKGDTRKIEQTARRMESNLNQVTMLMNNGQPVPATAPAA
jgi:biopolymer transport protein ExbB/TolQ